MEKEDSVNAAFLVAYNSELATLGSDVLISNETADCPERSFEILDRSGARIGFVPNTIEPPELAAFMTILRAQARAGQAVSVGRAIDARATPMITER